MTKRITQFLMLFVAFCMAAESMAADIRWNCFSQGGGATSPEIYWYGEWDGAKPISAWAFLRLKTETPDETSVSISPADGVILVGRWNWVVAALGDIACEATTRNLESYFMHHGSDTPGADGGGGPIVTDRGSSVYMMVMAEVLSDVAPSGLDTSSWPPYCYGWVELQVGNDGVVMLGSSAIDLDGGPMIVGGGSAIPEPSSDMLLLVGCVALFARRPRFTVAILDNPVNAVKKQ